MTNPDGMRLTKPSPAAARSSATNGKIRYVPIRGQGRDPKFQHRRLRRARRLSPRVGPMSNLADRITRDLMERTEKAYQALSSAGSTSSGWTNFPRTGLPILLTASRPATSASPSPTRPTRWSKSPNCTARRCGPMPMCALKSGEKDASDGYAPPIAGLYACRGFNSLTFISDTAEAIYYCDAYHACGAADRIAETLAKLADELILAQRLAVMPEQIATWPARRLDANLGHVSSPLSRPTISATTSGRSSKSICRSKSSKS